MTKDEVLTLLQVIAAYDNREAHPLMVAAWTEAATRRGWTFAAAVEAVHEHYAESSDWLMPGTVTQLIRRNVPGRKWQE